MGSNADNLREGIELLNQGKIREVLDRYDDHAEAEFQGSVLGGAYRGKQAIGQFFQKLGATFPKGAHINIKHLYETGETVVAEWVFSGILPDGTKYEAPGVNIFEYRSGKVVNQRGFFDTEHLARAVKKL